MKKTTDVLAAYSACAKSVQCLELKKIFVQLMIIVKLALNAETKSVKNLWER